MKQADYIVQNVEGETFDSLEFPPEKFVELIQSLNLATEEHPDVAVTHRPTGWHLTLKSDGRAVLSKRFESRRTIGGLSSRLMLNLVSRFALDGPGSVSDLPWE